MFSSYHTSFDLFYLWSLSFGSGLITNLLYEKSDQNSKTHVNWDLGSISGCNDISDINSSNKDIKRNYKPTI